jgi:periplasmic protein TonB
MFSGLPAAQPKRWTTIFSFTLQAAVVSAALVFPLLYPRGLPEAFAHRKIFVPMREGDAHVPPSHQAGQSSGAVHLNTIVVNRSTFSFHASTRDTAATETLGAPSFTSVIGDRIGVPDSLAAPVARPMPRPASHPPLRISRMMEGNLIHRVDPPYPVIAKQAGVQGAVVIKAIINREGAIEREEVVGGPALLANAALQAVRQWKYRPYYLNGEPVEVETQITVNFVLSR